EINHAGGVLGRPLQLVNKDDHFDPAMGTQAINDLVAAGPPAVVLGSVMSQVTLAVAAVAVPHPVPHISPASSSPLPTPYAAHADDGYLFRTSPSDALQGKLLAERAHAKGFTNVGVIHLPGPYGEGLAAAFSNEFANLGGTITISKEYTPNQTSYTALLGDV